jgi:predicted CXXCH cytochrome family protein
MEESIMKRFFTRLFYGLLFALPLMLVTYALAQAGTLPQEQQPEQPAQPNCPVCHESFQESWETSAHGQAATAPEFQMAWEAKGSPADCLSCHVTGYDAETHTWQADGITCQACHDTTTANHPKEPMAAERSAKLCGDCHTETFFEWQASAHRQKGLDCVGCHDPHGTSLKAEDSAGQCASCHRERASNFAHSVHSQQGLNCADCHLAQLDDPTGEGHARLDHSFSVRLSTCNQCHAYDMHDPAQVHPENPTPQPPDALAAVESLSVVAEPGPVSPVGFAMLSGLFGLALGVILSPWLERRNGKARRGAGTSSGENPPAKEQ